MDLICNYMDHSKNLASSKILGNCFWVLAYWWLLFIFALALYLKSHWGEKKSYPTLALCQRKTSVKFYESICIGYPFLSKVKEQAIPEILIFISSLSRDPCLKQWQHNAHLHGVCFQAGRHWVCPAPCAVGVCQHRHCNFYCLSWCAQMCLVSIPRGNETPLSIPVPTWHYLIESLSGLPPLGCCNHLKSLDFGVLTRV